MNRKSFQDGETIFCTADASDAAYLLVDGTVDIVVDASDGTQRAIATIERGEYFGEMGVIDDQPRSATAIARGDVVCMVVDQDEFMDMLLKRPEESLDLLKLLFDRLRRANARQSDCI